MNHAELVERACRWLRNTKRCSIVVAEYTFQFESPDGFGWSPQGTILIECKSRRPDFLAHKRKMARRAPYYGMGNCRYYFANPGVVLSSEELPEHWGLLVPAGSVVHVIAEARWRDGDRFQESRLALSLLRQADKRIRPLYLHDWIKGR